jgi:Domain of unknown function (DUF4252)
MDLNLGTGDRIMIIRIPVVIAAGLLTGAVAEAQEYFDFGRIPGLPDEPVVQIDMSPMLLGFASETARVTDPATADLLASLRGLRLRVYHSIEDVDAVAEYMDDASRRLERASWQQVVRVRDDADVRIYMQADEGAVTGVTAMIVGDGEAVFINVAGSITPQQLARVASRFGAGQFLQSLGRVDAVPVTEP